MHPAYARVPDATYYAASTMKVAVLVAAYRAAEAGRIDLDEPVPVVNDFASAKSGAPHYTIDPSYDQDDEVWARVGETASLRWLARRMIIKSSNLATNLVLRHVGTPAVGEMLRLAGATRSRVERGITDMAARDAGIDNEVTARDLAVLLGAIAVGADRGLGADRENGRESGELREGGSANGSTADHAIAAPQSCVAILDVLFAQERLEDLAAGLPPGTRVAHKNGWVDGARHAAGIVYPDDAPPYVLAVCTTSPLEYASHNNVPNDSMTANASAAATVADAEKRYRASDRNAAQRSDAAAMALIARIAEASWADRHTIGATRRV